MPLTPVFSRISCNCVQLSVAGHEENAFRLNVSSFLCFLYRGDPPWSRGLNPITTTAISSTTFSVSLRL